MAIEIYEDNYPIVLVKFIGISTSEETQMYLNRLDEWLERENFFGLIVHKTNPDSIPNNAEHKKNAKDAHNLVVKWAKQNKPNMKQYCVGMAVLDEEMPAFQQKIAPKALGFLFGCPGQFFDSPEDAETWLQEKMYAIAE